MPQKVIRQMLLLLIPLLTLALAHGLDRMIIALKTAASRTMNTGLLMWLYPVPNLIMALWLLLVAWVVLIVHRPHRLVAGWYVMSGLALTFAVPLIFAIAIRPLRGIPLDMVSYVTYVGHSSAFLAMVGLVGLLRLAWLPQRPDD